MVVSDNGSHFTGDVLQTWLRSVGCESIFTAPRHPCSNGLAENFVKSLKAAIAANSPTTEDELSQVIDTFLLQYRNSIHATTGKSPASVFHGRTLRMPGQLDSTDVTFFRGNESRACRGMLLQRIGSRMYHILDLDDATVHRRHKDQFHVASPRPSPAASLPAADLQQPDAATREIPQPEAPPDHNLTTDAEPLTEDSAAAPDDSGNTDSAPATPELRRGQRVRRTPARYKDFVLQGRNM